MPAPMDSGGASTASTLRVGVVALATLTPSAVLSALVEADSAAEARVEAAVASAVSEALRAAEDEAEQGSTPDV